MINQNRACACASSFILTLFCNIKSNKNEYSMVFLREKKD